MRARTRAGRLAAWDAWLVTQERALLERPEPSAVVDVGFGETPVTLRELHAAVTAVNPRLHVIGVERDAGRAHVVATGCEVRAGGFELLASLGPSRVVRAANVVRAYRDEEVPAIHAALAAPLVHGGVVLEGSTDTDGAVSVWLVLRRSGAALHREALLFHTDFSRGFSPWLFRDWLPREFRRRVRAGQPLFGFLTAWASAWEPLRKGRSAQEAFVASAHVLAQRQPGASLIGEGFLRWAPREGIPHST